MARRRAPGSRERLRVLILIENLPLDRDSRVRRQCRSLVDAGHRVSVICPRRGPRRSVPDAGPVRVVTYPRPRDAASRWGYLFEYGYSLFMTAILTLWVAITSGFDTIQATSPPDLLWIVAAPYRLFGKRYVFDHHDLSPEIYRARFGSAGSTHRMLLKAEEYAVTLADAVISTNAIVRDRVAERTGVPLDRFTVVRNGPLLAEVSREHPVRDDLKRGRRWLCCWHGVMGREDRVDLAVRAAAGLVHEFGRRDCAFALIGDGEAREELEALADELDVTAWIEFPGWLGTAELSDYLATADIGLSPDPPDEHLDWMTPIKVIEYMAYGVPVVGFRRSEQTASAGEGGVFVPGCSPTALAAAIDDLLNDPDRRHSIGNRGRQRLEDGLAWDHQEEHYLSLHRRLAAGGGDR